MQPTRPRHLSGYAERALRALEAAGLGHKVSLGGALGLLHDVDSWWAPALSEAEREQVVRVVEEALSAEGEVSTRRWGEVVSVELKAGGRKVFSFRIAESGERAEAESVRFWVKTELLHALLD